MPIGMSFLHRIIKVPDMKIVSRYDVDEVTGLKVTLNSQSL